MQTLLLGTAQWGLDYGATNASGRLTDESLTALSHRAFAAGIRTVDTAAAYGDAETRVGALPLPFDVQTKVSAGDLDADGVVQAVRSSLTRLRRDRLDRCLIHDWPSLDHGHREAAAEGLLRARELGLVGSLGVSGYSTVDLDTAIAHLPDLDLVQVPASVLDQRLEGAAAIDSLRAEGVRIQVRSVFLQGVALAGGSGTPFDGHEEVLAVSDAAASAGVTNLELCLAFVQSRPWIDEIVVAPTTGAELDAILSAFDTDHAQLAWAELASDDLDLIDPRRWASTR
jgi:aryl-alcohol dehydrogenase-like predicted oxidoreductase